MPTDIVRSLRPSGGDYTSLAAWNTDNGGAASKDIVANDNRVILECYEGDYTSVGGDSRGTIERLDLAGWTTSITQYIIFRPPAGEGHGGNYATGYRMGYDTNYQQVVRNVAPRTRFIGIVIEQLATVNGFAVLDGNSLYYIEKCIIVGRFWAGGRNAAAYNTLFLSAWPQQNSFTGMHCYNCTLIRDNAGAPAVEVVGGQSGQSAIHINNVAYDLSVYASGTPEWDSITGYNASETATTQAPPDEIGGTSITSNIVAADFVDENKTNVKVGDWRPAGGGQLIGAGQDLSGTTPPDEIDWNDLAGNPRVGAWDIGAYASGAAPAPATKAHGCVIS